MPAPKTRTPRPMPCLVLPLTASASAPTQVNPAMAISALERPTNSPRALSHVTNAAHELSFNAVGRAFPAKRGNGLLPDEHLVLRDVTLGVTPGEVVAVIGASGCGKSTLLRIAAGLERPSSGAVRIDGTPVAGIDERCAVAFQEPRLLPWRSIEANIALGLPDGTARAEGAALIGELLELVGLPAFATHRPREISGGMAQRVSLARALARNPGVLLLDEPFGALDALTRLRMQDLLLDIHAAAPTTVLLVTHDVDEALQLADRVVLLATEPDAAGATVLRAFSVPGQRPRDRGSLELGELRARLLEGLGIERHRH
jgi:sulfonate transport system ATP-binding protein